MLRRLFSLREPKTSHDAFMNLIKAGRWEVALLFVAAVITVTIKNVFPSASPSVWAIVFVAAMTPPGVATLAVGLELVAAVQLRTTEKRDGLRTGRFLVDHDILIGFAVVGVVLIGSILFVLLAGR
jgi:hypothetical protein